MSWASVEREAALRERAMRTWEEGRADGDCTCESRGIALGFVTGPDDAIQIDPDCDVHGYLLNRETK